MVILYQVEKKSNLSGYIDWMFGIPNFSWIGAFEEVTAPSQTALEMALTPEEWILDNLFQPLGKGEFFTIPDALNSLSKEFIVSGTAPVFAKEWTWYKDVEESNIDRNVRLVEAYFNNVLNFVDRRMVIPSHSQELGKQIEQIASNVWSQVCRIENGEIDLWNEIFQSLAQLSLLIATEAPHTSKSIDEAVKWIKGGLQEKQLMYFQSIYQSNK